MRVVYSAFPIEPAQLADVVASLEKRFGRKLQAQVELEPGTDRRHSCGGRRRGAGHLGEGPSGTNESGADCLKPRLQASARLPEIPPIHPGVPLRRDAGEQVNATESRRNFRTDQEPHRRPWRVSADMRNQGTVVSVSDGIVRVHGLSDAMQGEMLEFPAAAGRHADRSVWR